MSSIGEYIDILGKGTIDTLFMSLLATAFAYLFGLPLGVILVITQKNHILPNQKLNAVLGAIVNITRSVPFIILLIAIIPFTRFVVGTTIGAAASVVPLVIGAIPFVARLIETSMKEIDHGVIEAAESMGASPIKIILKVMIPETMPSLILGISITTITMIGYSAMAGAVGGGGLGDIAIRYGYYRYQKDLMFLTIALLVIIVQAIQSTGNFLSQKIDKKINKNLNQEDVIMKRNKLSVIVLIAVLLLATVLSGCSGKTSGTAAATPATGSDASKTPALKVIKIGATPAPHAEILKFIAPILKEKGIDLQIVEFTDYVQPNMALQNKELDANYFQHVPYLDDFNAKNNTQLSATVAVHFEPLGIYPGKTKALADLKDGDTIAVPNDTTNEARALLLLQDAGIVKLKDGAGLDSTVKDIVENPKNIKIQELEAAQISRSLPDVNLAVINGNYAMEAGLNAATDSLKSEDKDSLAAKTFANVIVVRTGDENREEIKILDEVITSPEVRDYINQQYKGAVIPVF